MRQRLYISFAFVAAMGLSGPSQAQPVDAYPSKPVTVITPAAAGNSPDVAARIVADRLTQIWKQQVLILNRPGAGGQIAAQAASNVERDGYTLYMTQASTYTVLPVMQNLPFDLDKAFVPIGLVGEQPIAVAVTPDLPVATLPELMALARKTQGNKTSGGMLYGATNRGGQSHLTGELLRARADLPLTFVHASGAAASINDVSTGRIPIMFEAIAGLAGAIQGKLVKPIAVASAQRLPNFPDIPTFAETLPGFESKGWLALMAPAGTPDAIVIRIAADLATVLAQPEVKDKLATLGTYVRALSPNETAAFIKSEQALWWPIVRAVNETK
jgi:tripartite-type tricarboxylate transporter receptor subunit TctC